MSLRFFSNEFHNHCLLKYKCSITIIFCDSHTRKNFLNWKIIRKTFGIWIKVIINILYQYTLPNNLNLSTWFNVYCNGIAMMVLSVKKRSNLKRHLLSLTWFPVIWKLNFEHFSFEKDYIFQFFLSEILMIFQHVS